MRSTLFCVVTSLIAVGSVGAQDLGRAMLSVNGETITVGEYYRRMENLADVGRIVGERFVERTPAFLTIERLVTERIVMQLAKKHGVAPTPGEIDNEYNIRKQDNPEQIKSLTNFGVTESDIKGQVAIEMAQFNLLTKGITITDQQISDHYNSNKFFYTVPAMATLRVIVVRDQLDRAKVDAALKTQSFGAVARQLSVDLSKHSEDGGMLGEVPIERLPPNIRNWVEHLPAGSNTPWIESQESFLIYRIEKKTDARELPLDDRLRRQIRKKMMLDMGRAKNDVKAMMDEMLKTVKVEISVPWLQNIWNDYIKDFQGTSGGR